MKKDKSERKAAIKAAIVNQLKSLAVPVILCAVILGVVYFVMNYQNSDEAEEAVKIKRYEGSEDPMILENEELLLTLDPMTTHFTLLVKDTGAIWYSNPVGAAENPLITSKSEKVCFRKLSNARRR